MKFSVYVTNGNFQGNPIFLTDKQTDIVELYDEDEAIEKAKALSNEYPHYNTYIFFQRSSDGQTGFLNPNGYGINAVSWTE